MATLGQTLKEARLKKKLTASEAARGTRIKIQHIDAIERDDFTSIAAAAYAKGFIRIYADFLGLDSAPLVQEYMDKHAPAERAPLLPDDMPAPSEPRQPREPFYSKWSWPKITLPKFKWPSWSSLPRPNLKWPRLKVKPRLFAIYAAALLIFLGILFGVSRCERSGELRSDEPILILPDETPTPSAIGVAPPDRPLPILDLLPEPYLE